MIPSTRRVAVQAVKPGTEGNVPANAIRVVPQGENPEFLKVNNPNPTDGGTRTETPEITQAELDKAVAQLETQLHQTFEDTIAAGAGAPADTTLFPATAVLGPSVPDPDPKTLVGQAVPTYDLALSRDGSVIAVDPRPVDEIATQQLEDKIGADHQLVEGSIDVEVGEGTVGEDGQVSFQATARAQRIPILDPAVLRSLVKGKTQAEAEAALAPYGAAKVVLWPSWASTVTGFDSRLDLTVRRAARRVGRSGPGTLERARRQPRSATHPERLAGRVRRPVTRLLGLDVGDRRIGVAVADRDGHAFPLTTLRRTDDPERDGAAIAALVRQHEVDEIVVGMPFDMQGGEGEQAAARGRSSTASGRP